MKKISVVLLALVAIPTLAGAKPYKEMFGADPTIDPKYANVLKAMDFKQGNVTLTGAHAVLKVPEGYYYLDGSDTEKVLSQLWGNPPAGNDDTLGMIFPTKYTPEARDSWGAIITYKPDGYVSDTDAESMDYNAVLKDLQQQTSDSNENRKKDGYEPIQLVGWASPPFYDKSAHALHWARDLLFGTDITVPHTLNYQLRLLGREGVLEMNFVAGMPSLQEVKDSIPKVTGLVEYEAGKKYGDFRDGDTMAAYGLGGLILAGAGAKVAAKVGFLAIALLFLKKGFVFVLIAAAAIFKPIMRFFRKKPDGPA